MNAHNEQHDPASPVVKQNLTTQPAAAQEAAVWQWRNLRAETGWKDCTRAVYDVFRQNGLHYEVRKLYAAPVTAAPADARSLALAVEQALGWRDGERDAELDSLLETAMSILDRTPAAPGIDQAIAAVESIQQYMRDDFQALPPEVFSLPQKAQRALVTLRGLADAPMRVHPRDAKEAVDYVVAHMLADSPKGGSEAVKDGEVLVTVSGLTGSGKSAVAGEIEILCKALGLEVEWADSEEEKLLTHADWTEALELYKPRVRIVEVSIPRAQAGNAEVQP